MQEHDYAGALQVLEYVPRANEDTLFAKPLLTNYELDAIRHALLIADKLMQEPSDGMCDIDNDHFLIRDTFKAMRDQMIKEATDGK